MVRLCVGLLVGLGDARRCRSLLYVVVVGVDCGCYWLVLSVVLCCSLFVVV